MLDTRSPGGHVTLDEQLYWMAAVTDRAADGDEEALLSPSAAALAAALTARLDEVLDSRRPDILGALALYHAARCAALPLGSAVDDQQMAFRYFAELDGAPSAVPSASGPPSAFPGPVAAADPDELMRRWQRLMKKAERSGRVEDLAAAAGVARELAHAGGDDADETAQLADCACLTLAEYAETAGDLTVAREAVAAGERAVAHATPHGGHRLDALGTLGRANLLTFELSQDPADLDALIATSHVLLSACPSQDVDTLRIAHGELGQCYRMRAVDSGSAEDLEASLHHHEEALALTPRRHPDHAMYIVNYVTALADRGNDTGSVRHLEEALRLGRTIRGSTGDPERDVMVRVALHTVCHALSFANDDTALFDESLDHIRAAARIRDVEPGRRRDTLARLTATLVDAYGRRMPDEIDANGPGVLPAEQRRAVPRGLPGLLDEAIRTGAEAIRLASLPGDDCAAHAHLASALTRRAILTGSDDDARAAVEQGRAAAARTGQEDRLRPAALDVLARALRLRYAASGDVSSAAEAAALWRESTTLAHTDVEFLLLTATSWGEVALAADLNPSEALDAYTVCLDAFASLAGRNTVRGDVERRLARWHGLAGQAAVAAVRAERPGRALELLEYGRTLMWNRLLDDRSDLDGLRRLEPELADEVEMLRAELDVAHAGGPGSEVKEAERLAVLGRRWDGLVERVRGAGFADFMRPPDLDRLLRRTRRGPVVVLNATLFGSHALVARPDGVRVVDLPDLLLGEAVERVSAYLDALYAPTPDEAALRDIHAWLWHVIAEPVLNALGPTEHLWWCPTGVLGLLPIHAASGPTGSVLDRVVSSYTASVRSLPADDGPSVRRVLDDGGRLLFVGMEHTDRVGDLAGVAAERDLVHEAVGDRVDTLYDSGARCADVVDALARYPMLHFSGHGVQHAEDPSSGGLILTDGVLSVARLATAQNRGAALAVLSACQTATGGLVNTDEAITLTSALQFGGWRAVVGTLWPVRDSVAVQVTRRFYDSLLDPSGISPAHALHATIRRQRDRQPNNPSLWAPFIHVGV